jgi:hypothetical protein
MSWVHKCLELEGHFSNCSCYQKISLFYNPVLWYLLNSYHKTGSEICFAYKSCFMSWVHKCLKLEGHISNCSCFQKISLSSGTRAVIDDQWPRLAFGISNIKIIHTATSIDPLRKSFEMFLILLLFGCTEILKFLQIYLDNAHICFIILIKYTF